MGKPLGSHHKNVIDKPVPCIVAMLDDTGAIVWIGITQRAQPYTLIKNYWHRARRGNMALNAKVTEWLASLPEPPKYKVIEQFDKDTPLSEMRRRRDALVITMGTTMNEYNALKSGIVGELAYYGEAVNSHSILDEIANGQRIAKGATAKMFWSKPLDTGAKGC